MALGKAVHELAYKHGIGFAVIPDGVADAVLRRNIILQMADAVYTGSLVAGLILWGLSFCWYVLATTVLLDHWWNTNRAYFGRESFSVGFTALIFPIGVWAVSVWRNFWMKKLLTYGNRRPQQRWQLNLIHWPSKSLVQ